MINRVDIKDLAAWTRALPAKQHALAVQAIRVSVKMRGPAMLQASIDSAQPHPPVNTGEYRRNWQARNIEGGCRLMNPTVQAGLIERGRRPGTGVSREGQEALARWAHLHGMDRQAMTPAMKSRRRAMRKRGVSKEGLKARTAWSQENRARGIAFVIARAIKRRGLFQPNGLRVLGRISARLAELVRADVRDVLIGNAQRGAP